MNEEHLTEKVIVDRILLERALDAVNLLHQIRCHPRRHDMERTWLTDADRVIGYWETFNTRQRIRAILEENAK